MPSLEQLQAAEAAQGAVQLRTLALEFTATLKRLPRLMQEVDSWLNNAQAGVDLNALATRLAPQLVAATNWLLDYDMLPAATREVVEMQAFMKLAADVITSRTLEALVQKYQTVKQDASRSAAKIRQEAEDRAAAKIRQEAEERAAAKIRQEAEERKRRDEQAAAQAKAQAEERKRRDEQAAAQAKAQEPAAAAKARHDALQRLGYIDHGNGTVTDTKTRLMWKQCAEGQSGPECSDTVLKYNWDTAMKIPKSLNLRGGFAGHSDWRVPSKDELETLVFHGNCPTICLDAFPNAPAEAFWSSSEYGPYNIAAWCVNFIYGGVSYSHRDGDFALRLVRASQ